jgi:predicted nucleic acid-binding protein
MLYLDASALIKRYLNEKGSVNVAARFESGEKIFTSMISFGEVHAAIARKFRLRELEAIEITRIRETFERDWLSGLSVLDLDLRTMSVLPRLVERYPLKSGDAIHLCAAFWLKDSIQHSVAHDHPDDPIEFGVSDRRLGEIAAECGFQIFDPEDQV